MPNNFHENRDPRITSAYMERLGMDVDEMVRKQRASEHIPIMSERPLQNAGGLQGGMLKSAPQEDVSVWKPRRTTFAGNPRGFDR